MVQQMASISVVSDNTDVFVLLMHYHIMQTFTSRATLQ